MKTGWQVLSIPIAVTIVSPAARAEQYMTLAQAQKHAFPNASQFLPTASGDPVWQAMAGNQVLGWIYFDRVIGKHDNIDYTVAVEPGGRVRRVDILTYRELYGGEVRQESWLQQFVGKTASSALHVGQDISNISGATLSCTHLSAGVKKVMAIHAAHFH